MNPMQDLQVFASLSTGDVTSWLRANGWVLTRTEVERYFRFTKDISGDVLEVDVPYSSYLRDRARRMAEVLDVLEVAEGRSQTALLRDIRQAQVDVARLRIKSGPTRDGRIPLEQGVVFFAQARNMMLAAACATIDKRPVFTKKKSTMAMNFLRGLNYGPSEEGSYVATIECPVPPALQSEKAIGKRFQQSGQPSELLCNTVEDTPFERRVMTTLLDALRITSSVAREASATTDILPFQGTVAKGVSSNLCDAVAGMLEPFEFGTLEIEIGWASSRPNPAGIARVRFEHEVVPVLRSAAHLLKTRKPHANFKIIGVIDRLESTDPDAGGTIAVMCCIEGRKRRVWFDIDSANYRQALKAHRKKLEISLEGDLFCEGTTWTLYNPRNFRIREEP